MFWCFVGSNSAFSYCFVLFRMIDLCIGWVVIFSLSRMLNGEMYSFFLIFYFGFQKSRMCLLRCSLHCAHILNSLVTIILALFWHLHLFSVYCFFSVVKKLNDFRFFLDFRHFFGLQLISFNIRQYWEFASKSFPKFTLTTFYCNFLPALVLV